MLCFCLISVSGLRGGEIAGIAVGVIVLMVVAPVLVLMMIRIRQGQSPTDIFKNPFMFVAFSNEAKSTESVSP